MADNADVRSLEQLDTFLGQSERFRAQLLKEIENLQVELRRLTNWIEVEVREYWRLELQRAQRRLAECQDALTRCMSYVREDERKPCTEEKKRLKKAQERRATCEEKLKIANTAASFWQRELTKNHAKVQRARDLAESDMTVAIHHLRDQIEQLLTYTGLKSAAFANFAPASDSKPATKDQASEQEDQADAED